MIALRDFSDEEKYPKQYRRIGLQRVIGQCLNDPVFKSRVDAVNGNVTWQENLSRMVDNLPRVYVDHDGIQRQRNFHTQQQQQPKKRKRKTYCYCDSATGEDTSTMVMCSVGTRACLKKWCHLHCIKDNEERTLTVDPRHNTVKEDFVCKSCTAFMDVG